jgi:hypothetical protein
MMPVLGEIAESQNLPRDPGGMFQRCRRRRLVGIIEGFDHLQTFSHPGGRFLPDASRAVAAGIISDMVYQMASGARTAKEAAQATEVERRALRRHLGRLISTFADRG